MPFDRVITKSGSKKIESAKKSLVRAAATVSACKRIVAPNAISMHSGAAATYPKAEFVGQQRTSNRFRLAQSAGPKLAARRAPFLSYRAEPCRGRAAGRLHMWVCFALEPRLYQIVTM